MNDASGERVNQHIKAAEPNGTKLPEETDNDPNADHLDPSRWWFASSAFPMIAGTLGPVASAFSICALVKPWRQSFPPGTSLDLASFIGDPHWLTAINAIQLAVAITANMALLLNMARRLSFSVAQPVTIVGWYVSSLSLVALTATAAGPLIVEPSEEFIWSQAFYYAIYSASLYFLVASLMVVTYVGAERGHYPKDFMLTPSQRTLMLQTIMFLLYLLLGALVFSKIEDWSYLDAVYWAAVTLFTVGFGDMYATSVLGRALLMPYALIGIISLGLVIGSIRSLVLDRGRRRLGARILEKKRRRTLRHMKRKGKDDVLVPIRNQGPTVSTQTDSPAFTEFERREREFELMRKIQRIAAHRRRWFAMAVSTSTWLILWLAGARVFQECEKRYQGWSYFDGFYFAFVSLTTIGYGDITPVSNAGKSFWVFWALLALPTMTVLISNAGDTIVKSIRDTTDQVATVTILPGERGFKKELKLLLRSLSCGVLFEEEIEETPPGLFGDVPRVRPDSDDDDEEDDVEEDLRRDESDRQAEGETSTHRNGTTLENDEENGRTETSSSPKSKPNHPSRTSSNKNPPSPPSSTPSGPYRSPSVPRLTFPTTLPSSKPAYRILLIDEIARVTQHLKHTPPRKYTFHEWAWYLRLIGQDEADGGKHQMAGLHHRGHGREKGIDGKGQDGKGVDGKWADGKGEDGKGGEVLWSWVGSRSPLMGGLEEAEWILERLISRLGDELRDEANDE